MKYFPLALLTFAAIGCGRNEFDVSPAQVSSHKGRPKLAGTDQVHMPPEGFKTEMKFKKGDRLPDGTLAEQDGKISADGR